MADVRPQIQWVTQCDETGWIGSPRRVPAQSLAVLTRKLHYSGRVRGKNKEISSVFYDIQDLKINLILINFNLWILVDTENQCFLWWLIWVVNLTSSRTN